jgi:hypothetical protein
MLKNPTGTEVDTSPEKFTDISRQVYPTSLVVVSVGNCQTALVDESRMIRTQTGTHDISEMVAVHGTLCASIPQQ